MHTPASVDPKEVAYYERLAHTWWDRTGPFWPLHRLNELRVAYIRDYLCKHFTRDPGAPEPLSGLRMLDIGCGGGILSEAMAGLGAEAHGVDVVQRNITVARLHAAESGSDVAYTAVSAEALAGEGETYDVVLNMEVVEHVADLPGFLQACCRLVRPGGIMFIATINRNPLSWLFAIVGAEYILRWLPKGTHRWDRFLKPRELEDLLTPEGLEVRDRRGVRVNPFTRHFAVSGSLGVNYMLAAHRPEARAG